ncbi:hypothetical protein ABR737_00585 [Streptomyces sp. Edi2]|uniref:hypothetical protein n=1 Tax=Streptomyces sp. Edi2 TaxID=3162528 RepID=UPI003305D6C2
MLALVGAVAFVAATLGAKSGHALVFIVGVTVTLGVTGWLAYDAWRTRNRAGR